MSFVATAIAVSVAQTALSITSQQNMAKAQAEAQRRQSLAENKRLASQQSAERINQQLQNEQANDQINKAHLKAMQAASENQVKTGESGVRGISIDALDNDLKRKYAVYSFGLQKQLKDKAYQTELELEDNQLGSTQRQYAINKPIAEPDYASSIASGLNTGLSIYGLKE